MVPVCVAVMLWVHTTVRLPEGVSLMIWYFTSSELAPSFWIVPVMRTVVVATRVPFARVSAEVVVQVGAMATRQPMIHAEVVVVDRLPRCGR